MAHEKSVTVKHKGRWVNIPSVVNGKTVSEDTAAELLRAGKIKPLGGRSFDTAADAVKAAKARSAGFSRNGAILIKKKR